MTVDLGTVDVGPVDLGRVGIWSRELRYNPDRGRVGRRGGRT